VNKTQAPLAGILRNEKQANRQVDQEKLANLGFLPWTRTLSALQDFAHALLQVPDYCTLSLKVAFFFLPKLYNFSKIGLLQIQSETLCIERAQYFYFAGMMLHCTGFLQPCFNSNCTSLVNYNSVSLHSLVTCSTGSVIVQLGAKLM